MVVAHPKPITAREAYSTSHAGLVPPISLSDRGIIQSDRALVEVVNRLYCCRESITTVLHGNPEKAPPNQACMSLNASAALHPTRIARALAHEITKQKRTGVWYGFLIARQRDGEAAGHMKEKRQQPYEHTIRIAEFRALPS